MDVARKSPDETSARARFPMLQVWSFPDLLHGFMTREGGVSDGPYRSFNLAEHVGDNPGAVKANWLRWRAMYPGVTVARVQQVHGNQVHRVEFGEDAPGRIGDGMVTRVPGIVLAIFTADCVPLLMVDPEGAVVGALHAGWRGVLAGIAAKGLAAMAALGASLGRIHVALGPSIGGCCFEVDTSLADKFVSRLPAAAKFCRPGPAGKPCLNLRAIIRSQLAEAGISPHLITDVGPCTRCNPERFFSRRAAAGARTGLQMSFIGLAEQQ
jgi:YfiH family protein